MVNTFAGIQSAGIQSSYVIVNCLPVTWETIWISGFYKGNKIAENDTKLISEEGAAKPWLPSLFQSNDFYV